jgi:folate-dependent phosphoribosylglycinamide formyltransferase PurN
MEKIIMSCQQEEFPVDIACVVSSKSAAGGVERAKQCGIPEEDILVIDPRTFPSPEAFGAALLQTFSEREVTLITQNGWLVRTPDAVIDAYRDRIFNQHPGPVPEFGGASMFGRRVHAARLGFIRGTDREYWTEAVAHRVTEQLDGGAVVVSERVDVLPEDTVEALAARVLPVEHAVQLRLLQGFVDGTLSDQPSRPTLVFPGEAELLETVKYQARREYPNG